jgi:hypothetical protein
MTDRPELWAALLPVVDALESQQVPYYVGGSVASSFTGIARATQDADLVADLRTAHVSRFVQALEESYYISSDRVRSAVRDRKSFNLIHLETAFKVDVFVLPLGAFARKAMDRRVPLEVPEAGRVLDFCSPEDIVLSKLQWYEAGARVSDRQWYDLQGVLRLQGELLDLDYLRRWGRVLGVGELLEKALGEAGVGDAEAQG